ncbi:MAG: type I methionyl aminopeptidase [Patescibacteria group bacterium]
MIIENTSQYQLYKHAAQISMEILRELYEMTKPGIFPVEIDQKAFDLCKRHNVVSSFYGVPGAKSKYEYASCISLNDEAVHGIPSSTRQIQPGDLVKLDFGIISETYYTDHCVTVGIEKIKNKDYKLLEVGKQAVLDGVAQAKTGKMTGDIGHAIESTARKSKFDTIKYYIGHGIGHHLHEDPEVPAAGRPNTGTVLKEGQVICVEAQVVAGSPAISMDPDGWTVRTRDGKNAVMFEYMTIVRNGEPEILTDTRDWPLIRK